MTVSLRNDCNANWRLATILDAVCFFATALPFTAAFREKYSLLRNRSHSLHKEDEDKDENDAKGNDETI